jgi:hypothetical protein
VRRVACGAHASSAGRGEIEAGARELLDTSLFEAAVGGAIDRLTRQQADTVGLVAKRGRLAREIGHLVNALARGGDVPSHVAELRTREARKQTSTSG